MEYIREIKVTIEKDINRWINLKAENMKLLKWLFGSRKPALNKPVVKRSYFSVEFYPLTKRYYPKYKNYYMIKNYQTGIIEPKEEFLFVYANYSDTEEGAEKIIEMFKEQQLKKNVRTIEK